MLDVKILNSQATLNDFKEIGSLEYVPGENLDVVVRLFNSQLDIRYIPDPGATYTLVFEQKDGTELSKTPTELSAEDRSILTTSLTPTETENIVGSNIRVEVTEGPEVKKGVARNALSKILLGDC
jgi:hypothetical protein